MNNNLLFLPPLPIPGFKDYIVSTYESSGIIKTPRNGLRYLII